jgi:hypothetical protein
MKEFEDNLWFLSIGIVKSDKEINIRETLNR